MAIGAWDLIINILMLADTGGLTCLNLMNQEIPIVFYC